MSLLQPRRRETERLLLRLFQRSDFAAVHAYGSDVEVTRYMDWGPNTEDETRQFVDLAVGHSLVPTAPSWEFAVVSREDGELLGGTGIHFLGPGRAEIGYCYSMAAWGRGVATEAGRDLLRLGFAELRLHRIQARCDPENTRSARVLEKLGMSLEGQLRECHWVRDRWADRLLFAILEQEWRARSGTSVT